MDREKLSNTGKALDNVAAAIAERLRHEGQAQPFEPFSQLIDHEVLRLRGEGQNQLADALAKLSEESGK
jgi:hypothetical protein